MTEQELKELHSIINDTWQYFKHFSDITDTDAYWDDLIRTADEIWYRHNQHPLCRAYLEATMKYLEKQVHEKRGTG